MVLQELLPKLRAIRGETLGPGIDFLRRNVVTSTVALGAGVTGLIATAAVVRSKRRKAKATVKRKKAKSKRRGRKKTAAEIRAMRLRNLAKARRARKTGTKKRRIIRGPGLGRGEIKHSGKGTKGTKLVKFRTKSGKIVTFKVKGTSKRRRGFKK